MRVAVTMPIAQVRTTYVVWTLVAAAVGVQIAYPLMPEAWRTEVTVASVGVFFLAVVADVGRVHGLTGVAARPVLAAVAVRFAYPRRREAWRTEVPVASVVVFFLAVVADVARVHGLTGAAVLAGVAGGGGLVAESVGVATGLPFGHYFYTGTLGAEVLGVPAVVPLAWVMMAWPALVVARTLVRGPAVAA